MAWSGMKVHWRRDLFEAEAFLGGHVTLRCKHEALPPCSRQHPRSGWVHQRITVNTLRQSQSWHMSAITIWQPAVPGLSVQNIRSRNTCYVSYYVPMPAESALLISCFEPFKLLHRE